LFAEGGIFIPTTRDYKLGDDVYVLLSLPDDPSATRSRARWPGSRQRAARPTVHRAWASVFPSDEKSKLLKIKIEEILGAHLGSDRPTQTI
jgi:type IV pilus assembly protein PilZ